MKEKLSKIFNLYGIPMFLAIISIVMLIIGLNTVKDYTSFSQTTGEIVSITSEYDVATESINYKVFVKYSVNDREYTSELGSYKAEYREGMKIKIKYDPENPVKIMTGEKSATFIPFIVAAVVLVRNIKTEAKYKREHEYDM